MHKSKHGKQKAVSSDEETSALEGWMSSSDDEAPPQEYGDKNTNTSQTAGGSSSARSAKGTRNALYRWPQEVKKGSVPRTMPSYVSDGVRSSLSNAMPGQHHTKVAIEDGLKVELVGATFVADDLADQMFGSLISTELASEVLAGLLTEGMVTVEKEMDEKKTEVASHSNDARAAVRHALERALAHGCKRPGVMQHRTPQKNENPTSWNWTWVGYPTRVVEKDLVNYLNKIVDTALGLPILKDRQPRYRFAVPNDTTHAFPLAYPPDKADMRPDFVVLPIEAFTKVKNLGGQDEYTLEEKWLNFTTLRLTGECKASNAKQGATQVQRYMRGTNRMQPWQRFITGLVVTRQQVTFLRAEGSGLELFHMKLEYGRSSLEFVRVLLGIVLADDLVFGLSPHFDLAIEDEETVLPRSLPAPPPASSDGFYRTSTVYFVSHGEHETPGPPDAPASVTLPVSSGTSSNFGSGTTRSSTKRKRKDDAAEEPGTSTTNPPPKKRTAATKSKGKALYAVRKPKRAFGYECLGSLFNVSSLRGRNTRALLVAFLNKTGGKVYAALKISWQDTERAKERTTVRAILDKFRAELHEPSSMALEVQNILAKGWHNNVLFPQSPIEPVEVDSTLRNIRAFTDAEAGAPGLEDRVLDVSWTPLKRPVQYFWSVQDFVKGLIGALRGHQFLTHMGILHRDVSENNIVLGVLPTEERGYIMDMDMAIPYGVPQDPSPEFPIPQDVLLTTANNPGSANSGLEPYKVARTGTAPYMSANVLSGIAPHTHFDDIESFFYVLMLFFVSYKGPLPESELMAAHDRRFALEVTSSRPTHITPWPDEYQKWAGEMDAAMTAKFALMNRDMLAVVQRKLSGFVMERWVKEVVSPIKKLIFGSLALFHSGTYRQVHHEQFIGVLEQWLEENPVPAEGQNSCPFKDENGRQAI
ncbi:hypothetical protein HYDPIDRAFT_28927 [Hydnomerulius pinastri MD-312]|uniref:Protein kinase domain-containing protein n=1 Tax=Hydnomerulius pinastri MD-312 TaxID=994086 RepID=A0A0C9W8V0_9AGAM|nr:hypothetical protein HYDPIDRAFT_28927 [Hydnomerulius pinastri MD-312]